MENSPLHCLYRDRQADSQGFQRLRDDTNFLKLFIHIFSISMKFDETYFGENLGICSNPRSLPGRVYDYIIQHEIRQSFIPSHIYALNRIIKVRASVALMQPQINKIIGNGPRTCNTICHKRYLMSVFENVEIFAVLKRL